MGIVNPLKRSLFVAFWAAIPSIEMDKSRIRFGQSNMDTGHICSFSVQAVNTWTILLLWRNCQHPSVLSKDLGMSHCLSVCPTSPTVTNYKSTRLSLYIGKGFSFHNFFVGNRTKRSTILFSFKKTYSVRAVHAPIVWRVKKSDKLGTRNSAPNCRLHQSMYPCIKNIKKYDK